ncbi:MAG: hypothetical protein ACRD3Q_00025, partial [Terriglobales bacterium]
IPSASITLPESTSSKWRPADIHAGTISLRTHGKNKDGAIQHECAKAERRQTGGPEQYPPRADPGFAFASQTPDSYHLPLILKSFDTSC